jgi:2-iminobutanoate/2-iminopropanoate deaminase
MTTTEQHKPVTEFLIPPNRDLKGMAKFGLGGSAVAAGYQFAGAMAIDLTTLSRLAEADTIENETKYCLEGLLSAFALGERKLEDIVKITAYVSDESYREEMWATLREAFEPGKLPKCITLVAGLAGDCRVELEAVAYHAEEPDSGYSGHESTAGFVRPNTKGPSAGAVTDNFVFMAATAIDPTTMRRVPEAGTVKDELQVIFQRIEQTLQHEGLTLRDLTKVTAWVSEEQYRLDFAHAYRDLLAPGPYPSRALFQIGLPGDCRIQIDAIAARNPNA